MYAQQSATIIGMAVIKQFYKTTFGLSQRCIKQFNYNKLPHHIWSEKTVSLAEKIKKDVLDLDSKKITD